MINSRKILFVSKPPARHLRVRGKLPWHHKDDDQRTNTTALAPAFTCRQIYLEVTPIYYGKNTFIFWDPCSEFSGLQIIQKFIAAIGPENASSISSINTTPYSMPVVLNLERLPGLKRLEVTDCRRWVDYRTMTWPSEMLAYVRNHPAVVITYNGVRFSVQDWESFPKYSAVPLEELYRKTRWIASTQDQVPLLRGSITLHSIVQDNP